MAVMLWPCERATEIEATGKDARSLHDVCAIENPDGKWCECECHLDAGLEAGRYCDSPFGAGERISSVFTSRRCRRPATYKITLSGEVVIGGAPFRARHVEVRNGEQVVYACGQHVRIEGRVKARVDAGEAVEFRRGDEVWRWERNDPGWET
jgi:hypothetical protein